MSANNWAVCPRCLRRAKAAEAERLAEVMDSYGKVPVEEFDQARADVKPVDERDYETFREGYEIYGAVSGVVSISYGGSCTVCGLRLEVDEKHPIPGAGDE